MVYKFRTTVTPSAGSGSVNTVDVSGEARYLYVSPATATTTYKVSIVDDDSHTVKSTDWVAGVFRDFTPFLVRGIYTVSITESTVDEAFAVKMLVAEKV